MNSVRAVKTLRSIPAASEPTPIPIADTALVRPPIRPKTSGGANSCRVEVVPTWEVTLGMPESANNARYTQIAVVIGGAFTQMNASTDQA